MDLAFVLNSILFGAGLAMDAFSVSVADALADKEMDAAKKLKISGCFAFFQFLMPLLGWCGVHFLVEKFESFEKVVPWIALVLLLYIGGGMLVSALKKEKEDSDEENTESESIQKDVAVLTLSGLLIQGIATSIDALSVGFTISEYGFFEALVCALIIGATTFVICNVGFVIGRKAGDRLGNNAEIVGGLILIFIGLEIFIKGVIL